jgi:hypothetical protein
VGYQIDKNEMVGGTWRGVHRVLLGKPEEKRQLGRRIILKWIFRKWGVAWTGLVRFGIMTGFGLL